MDKKKDLIDKEWNQCKLPFKVLQSKKSYNHHIIIVTEAYIDSLNFVCKKKIMKKSKCHQIFSYTSLIYIFINMYKFTAHHLIAIHLIS